MPQRRLPLLISLAILALLCARLAFTYESLPATMASHFDAAGRPNGFQDKSGFALLAVLLTLGTLALFAALPRLLSRLPTSMINLPHRDYWLAPERKAESIARVTELLDWFGCATIALLACTFELALRANLRDSAHLDGTAIWLAIASYLGFAAVWSVSLMRAFRKPKSGSEQP